MIIRRFVYYFGLRFGYLSFVMCKNRRLWKLMMFIYKKRFVNLNVLLRSVLLV